MKNVFIRSAFAVSSLVLTASLALAQDIPTAEPEAVGLSSAKLKTLKTVMQQKVDQGTIPGAVIMIVRNG